MTDPIPTIGGVATRGEALTKLLYHLDECRNLAAVYAHLLNTEDNEMDRLLAKGWLGIAELFRIQRMKLVQMAQGKMQ